MKGGVKTGEWVNLKLISYAANRRRSALMDLAGALQPDGRVCTVSVGKSKWESRLVQAAQMEVLTGSAMPMECTHATDDISLIG
jgi:hypothetical protein